MLVSRAQADPPSLPTRSAEQLVTDVLTAKPVAFSGEISQKANLGLPDLSVLGGGHGQSSGLDPLTLLTGNHTWRVWSNGSTSNRVSLVDGSAEVSLISTPAATWLWDSAANTAYKGAGVDELAAQGKAQKSKAKKPATPHPTPATPAELAKQLLTQLRTTTTVSVDGTSTVAGRDAYQLVLTPKQGDSLVQQVRLAIDAITKQPLSVQVLSTKSSRPALQVGFASVSYSQPAASVFAFTPPSGAKTENLSNYSPTGAPDKQATKPETKTNPKSGPKVVGEGWSRVVVTKMDGALTSQLGALTQTLPKVSGSWGSGRLLEGTLFSVLLTDDGRVAVGAVAPSVLYAAL